MSTRPRFTRTLLPSLCAALLLGAAAQASATTYTFRVPVAGVKAATNNPLPAAASAISCGDQHCYAIAHGNLYVAGINSYGELSILVYSLPRPQIEGIRRA